MLNFVLLSFCLGQLSRCLTMQRYDVYNSNASFLVVCLRTQAEFLTFVKHLILIILYDFAAFIWLFAS